MRWLKNDYELYWDGRVFATGKGLVANYEESIFVLFGLGLIKRRYVERGINVVKLK